LVEWSKNGFSFSFRDSC